MTVNDPFATPSADEPRSTTDAAKDEARAVAEDAKAKGQDVVDHATDKAKQVTQDAIGHAKNLLGESRSELRTQANSQQQRIAQTLRDLGSELDSMLRGSDQQGLATSAASQLKSQTDKAADFLENRDFGGVLDEVTSFARRRPGAFLLGAAVLGLVAGRITRGMTTETEPEVGAYAGTDTGPVSGPGAGPYAGPAGVDTRQNWADVPPQSPVDRMPIDEPYDRLADDEIRRDGELP